MNLFLLDYETTGARIAYSGGHFEADLADTPLERWRGLRSGCPRPLLMTETTAVHTWGMDYPLDIWFGSPDGEILDFAHGVRSRQELYNPEAAFVVEIPAGWHELPRIGEKIELRWSGGGFCPLCSSGIRTCGCRSGRPARRKTRARR